MKKPRMLICQLSLSVFLLCLSLSAFAQELTVKSFIEKTNDLSAITYVRKDNNGTSCALVRVQLAASGASFSPSIIGSVDYKVNEYWVFLPSGSKHLKIQHPNFITLDVTFAAFGINALESKSTYELVLTIPDSVPIAKDKGGNMLAVSVTPASSVLYINEEVKALEGGQHMKFYPYGDYTYRVEASGYMSHSGTFRITSSEKTVLRISLESALATLNIECPTRGCEIYVNESKMGTDSYSSQVEDGMYLIEVRKTGYRTAQETVTLGKQEKRTVFIPVLTPLYGSLMVEAKPMDAEIYIDEAKRGTSPEIIENILVGEHTVKVSMSGYRDLVKKIQISEGEQALLSGELEKGFAGSAGNNINGYEYVDLGLPSGLLWATCNVGAATYTDYGDYYAWGETSTKNNYDLSTYKWCNGSGSSMTKYCTSSGDGTVDNKTVLESNDDVAYVKWGGSWRMPTSAEWDELKSNCTWTWTTISGVNGYKVTSKKSGYTGKWIFLPAAGSRYDSDLYYVGSYGFFWSSSLDEGNGYGAWYLDFSSGDVGRYDSSRCYGHTVRPVSE